MQIHNKRTVRNIKSSKVRNDIFLAVFIVVISLFALLIFKTTRKDGAYAVVIKDGVETSRYPLSENRKIKITYGEDEEKFNQAVKIVKELTASHPLYA